MDRRGMFGSRKQHGEDGAHDEAPEVRARQAEARAELAERRVRDADEIAAKRVTVASHVLLEVREVVEMLRDQVDAASGELASISANFEQGTGPKPKVDVGDQSRPEAPGQSDDREERGQREDRKPAGRVGEPTGGDARPAVASPRPGGGSPLQRATRMAMAGKSRERIARTLSEEFGVDDPTPILDEALGHQPD